MYGPDFLAPCILFALPASRPYISAHLPCSPRNTPNFTYLVSIEAIFLIRSPLIVYRVNRVIFSVIGHDSHYPPAEAGLRAMMIFDIDIRPEVCSAEAWIRLIQSAGYRDIIICKGKELFQAQKVCSAEAWIRPIQSAGYRADILCEGEREYCNCYREMCREQWELTLLHLAV